MKKLFVSWLVMALVLSAANAQYGTARTGYEGDYFSLEGALDLFRQSYTLRDFERKLNTEENWVNNLDLNYDGRIDYIRVEHRRQGNFHAIILQALVDRYDVQDVAVIELEVIGAREAVLQIVGDEDLYGEAVIVEPVEGYADSRSGYRSGYGDFVNVYYWSPVQYILGRQYQVYVSPYRWQYYPVWWKPWVQCTWNVFRPRIVIYQRYFHVVHIHRVIRVHRFYRPYRTYSYTVLQRTNKVRVKHGKPPVHREAPANRQYYGPRGTRGGDRVGERPDAVTRPRQPEQRAPVSRNRATPSNGQRMSRKSDPRSGTSTRPASPERKPAASSRTAPAAQPKVNRPSPSRNTETRPSTRTRSTTTTRPSAPSRKPATKGRSTAPASKPKSSSGTKPGGRSSRSRNGG